jgi:superfamily II DNA/RNA helicase
MSLSFVLFYFIFWAGLIGGLSLKQQRAAFGGKGGERLDVRSRAVDLVVGTPGRVLKCVNEGTLRLTDVKHLVLDEADTLLAPPKGRAAVKSQAGFDKDMDELLVPVLGRVPHPRLVQERVYGLPTQVVVVSATMTKDLVGRVKDLLGSKVQFLKTSRLHKTVPSCQQRFVKAPSRDRMGLLQETLQEIFSRDSQARTLVFCTTTDSARAVQHVLVEQGFDASCMHSLMPPKRRAEDFHKFLSNATRLLVCTDISARGLDFGGVVIDQVINFDFPPTAADYLHRAGRTARAGRAGVVTSFVPQQQRQSARLQRELAKAIQAQISKGQSLATLTTRREDGQQKLGHVSQPRDALAWSEKRQQLSTRSYPSMSLGKWKLGRRNSGNTKRGPKTGPKSGAKSKSRGRGTSP